MKARRQWVWLALIACILGCPYFAAAFILAYLFDVRL